MGDLLLHKEVDVLEVRNAIGQLSLLAELFHLLPEFDNPGHDLGIRSNVQANLRHGFERLPRFLLRERLGHPFAV